ncbi:hypothetical protein SASPL_100845 [Salvia splendens]|uniref:C2 domain-containing protein n=1 Tax=Salvia splendens TaxID=180675 RepID=A0A8X8YPV1_SALSN|nr:hypothetical protein SASPL_100845 [Salvia splendens]
MESYNKPKYSSHAPATGFGDATGFDLTLVSVNNLQCQRRFSSNIKVYAKVQLDGGNVRETGRYLAVGLNSTLNSTVHYPITNDTRGNLLVRLYYERTLGHTSIGEVTIDVTKLFEGWRDSRQNTKTFPLPKGELNITYRFALAQAGN